MNVKLAKTAGFCFGVKRAIEDILYTLPADEKKICTLGPIIHNRIMVKELEKNGIAAVDSIEETQGYDTVVIRSHGVEKAVTDQLQEMGREIVDATCPFVSKIHRIVYERSVMGDIILIAGDRYHPEVSGIMGHSVSKCYTFKNREELDELVALIPDEKNKRFTLVSQTTFDISLWQKFVKFLKKVYTNLEIFDTICNATSLRQQEADELSKECDAMLIIGDRGSSNTQKLYAIASKNCSSTYLVECADDLENCSFSGCETIGVTAGASTPDMIIKEVVDKL